MNMQKFTQKSLEAIQESQNIATENQNAQVEQEHLLLALLQQDKNKLKNLAKLSEFRKHFINFYNELEIEKIDLKQEKLVEFQEKSMSEMAWFQLLITLKFWMDDTSLSFEKTDIFIEKSVNTSFDLMDIAPLKSLIDFGKFMWKEKVSFKM